VGNFGAAARRLRELGLAEALASYVRADRPFFGMCLGMQLLFEGRWARARPGPGAAAE
jgi:glutamine amidotransferase/cyclase